MALKRMEGLHVVAKAAVMSIWRTCIGVVILVSLLGGRAALARELIWVTVEAKNQKRTLIIPCDPPRRAACTSTHIKEGDQ